MLLSLTTGCIFTVVGSSNSTVLATGHEQQQCQTRKDLGSDQGKGIPLVDQEDLTRT